MGRIITALICAVLLCGALFAAWYNGSLAFLYADYPERSPIFTPQPNQNPIVIAHRGDEKAAPENTLPAIEAAIIKQADFVELDIRLTSDGIPVLMHDSNTKRTTNKNMLVSGTSFKQLRTLDAGNWFAPEFKGIKIPTLEEAINLAEGKICLFADIKDRPNLLMIRLLKDFAGASRPGCLLIATFSGHIPEEASASYDQSEGLDEETRQILLNRALWKYKIKNAQIAAFRRYWPEFPLIRPYRKVDTPEKMLKTYPSLVAVTPQVSLITPDLVNAIHAAGLLIILRTRTQNATYRKVLDAGVDGIWVSNIASLRSFLESYNVDRLNVPSQSRTLPGI